MNPQSFASLITSILLFGSSPVLSTPVRTVAQSEPITPTMLVPTVVAPTVALPTTTAPAAIPDIYQQCQQHAPAVVTLYAGAEIGTGSIISREGLLITNHHVVQEAVKDAGKTKIYIKLTNGTRYLGRWIKSDPANDLALVQINAQETFPAIVPLASPTSIRLGQRVCAIGNPFGLTSVSVGTLKDFRGTNDLKSAIFLNRGNSGGPLLNEQGEMIGVNKSIWLSETGENTGISFATSVRVAQDFINRNAALSVASKTVYAPLAPTDTSLQLKGRPVAAGGGLGAIVDQRSLTIRQIVVGSPADLSGLRPGDRLLTLDGKPLKSLPALQTVLNRQPVMAVFTVDRDRQPTKISVKF